MRLSALLIIWLPKLWTKWMHNTLAFRSSPFSRMRLRPIFHHMPYPHASRPAFDVLHHSCALTIRLSYETNQSAVIICLYPFAHRCSCLLSFLLSCLRNPLWTPHHLPIMPSTHLVRSFVVQPLSVRLKFDYHSSQFVSSSHLSRVIPITFVCKPHLSY